MWFYVYFIFDSFFITKYILNTLFLYAFGGSGDNVMNGPNGKLINFVDFCFIILKKCRY